MRHTKECNGESFNDGSGAPCDCGGAVLPVSATQLRMMRHAVGKRWHRNHYVASKGTEEDSLWMLLERAGYAREYHDGICMRTWHLTEAGQQLVRDLEDVQP